MKLIEEMLHRCYGELILQKNTVCMDQVMLGKHLLKSSENQWWLNFVENENIAEQV